MEIMSSGDKAGQIHLCVYLLCVASGTFIFFKAGTNMIIHKRWFGS